MDDEDWRVLSAVNRSKYRKQALKYLHTVDEPRTPTEIARKVDVSMNHVSRALREMNDRELVEVVNPDAPYDRRYRATDRGDTIATKLKEIEEE